MVASYNIYVINIKDIFVPAFHNMENIYFVHLTVKYLGINKFMKIGVLCSFRAACRSD